MGKVSDILASKNDPVLTIDHGATVLEAIQSMVEHNVGSVVVMKDDAILGIFTERDYLRRIALQGRASKTTVVADVTTERLVCVGTDRAVDDCMAMMTQERIRHLPVIEDGRLVGIVWIGDLVKFLSKEREIQIRYLTDFIAGKYPA